MVTTVSIYSCNEISTVTTSAVTFDVVTCVDPSYTTFTLSPEFTDLHTINIYSNNCPYVSTFSLSGLASLQTIVIGTNAFTVFPNSYNYNPNRSFHITNCPELLFLRFYPYSFSDYSGEFELANLPKLEVIQFGETVMENDALNFVYASLVLDNLPMLQRVYIGSGSFEFSLHTVFRNLPSLTTILIQNEALAGLNDTDCSLVLENLGSLITFIQNGTGNSFLYQRNISVINVNNQLMLLTLPFAFRYVETYTRINSPVIFDNYMWGVRIIRFTGEKAAEEGFVIYNATTSYELPLFSYFELFDNELRVEAIMLSPGIYTVYLVDAGGDGWPANSGVMMIKGRNDIIGYTLPSGYGAYDEIYIP